MTRRSSSMIADAGSLWQTIYCSLMLLLVVFFVMLIAYSAIDKSRLERISSIASAPVLSTRQDADINNAMQSFSQLTADSSGTTPLSITTTADGFKAVIPDPVLFNSGDASLNESIYPILDGIAAIAQKHRLIVQIEGHTDNVPIKTGAFQSNWELSSQRAVNILRYLQVIDKLPPDRLVAVGFAEFQPLADNGTPEGRRANRRIEIVFRPVK